MEKQPKLTDIVMRLVSDDHNPTAEIKWVLTEFFKAKKAQARFNLWYSHMEQNAMIAQIDIMQKEVDELV